jgi:hypothetical protein
MWLKCFEPSRVGLTEHLSGHGKRLEIHTVHAPTDPRLKAEDDDGV